MRFSVGARPSAWLRLWRRLTRPEPPDEYCPHCLELLQGYFYRRHARRGSFTVCHGRVSITEGEYMCIHMWHTPWLDGGI